MKSVISLMFSFAVMSCQAQELYVFTDPASNIPAKSIVVKVNAMLRPREEGYNRSMQRYAPEVMVGVNKKWMLRAGTTLADMHTSNFAWESVYLYTKYRFLSNDELHRHFRMALFAEAAHSRAPYHTDEVSLTGDRSGVRAGITATQLWNRLAVSGIVSHTQVLDKSRKDNTTIYIPSRIYQVMDYSVSAGYLVLPARYSDYRQTNLNIYSELLVQQSLDRNEWYADFAPALQLIFRSNTKLNLGYRFQLDGTMRRMSRTSWLIGIERTFLNAIMKKSSN